MNISSQGSKTIIITGTAGSIGSVLANSFRDDGITVIGIDKKENSSADEYYFHCDFNESTAVEQTIRTITQAHEKIDGLINCAGISLSSNNPYDLRLLEQTINVNLIAPFILSSKLIDYNIGRKFALSIVNITSLGSIMGFPGNPSYQVAKAGLAQLTKSMAVDFSKSRIRVNNLVPGYIESKMTNQSFSNPQQFEERRSRTAMGRWGKPDDLIGAAKFLISEESLYVTGTDLVVDGGWTIKGL
jgi:NAD(P)-dependent dehydrogenase (short-subunit alcohol dehydrogenase family)